MQEIINEGGDIVYSTRKGLKKYKRELGDKYVPDWEKRSAFAARIDPTIERYLRMIEIARGATHKKAYIDPESVAAGLSSRIGETKGFQHADFQGTVRVRIENDGKLTLLGIESSPGIKLIPELGHSRIGH
jgi:hypothetical protein